MHWDRRSPDELRRVVFDALAKNASYLRGDVLGYPGSVLDREVFPSAPFLQDQPFLSSLRENPNHIGCHTLGQAETAFTGTQRLELDLLRLCAEEIVRAPAGGYDGYVCSGGTEANLQALWVQRNLLRDRQGLRNDQICVLHSEDTHYSIPKAVDLLSLPSIRLPVDDRTRQLRADVLAREVHAASARGARAFVLVLNLGTTMFGSVDDLGEVRATLDPLGVDWRVHVDAAFGGFIYPFTSPSNGLDFAEPRVVSITMDGHKMLQAPYGTGVFLVRKGMIEHVSTEEARYVHGGDFTLCGSRSGANVVALWMILNAYGSAGGTAFLAELVARTDRLCAALDGLGVEHFRAPHMNVVAMRADGVPADVARRWHLVPDTHDGPPRFWKVVVMDHVSDDVLARFLAELATARRGDRATAVPTT